MQQQKPHAYDFRTKLELALQNAKELLEKQDKEIKFLVAEVNRLNKENAELKEQVNGYAPLHSSEIDLEYTWGDKAE